MYFDTKTTRVERLVPQFDEYSSINKFGSDEWPFCFTAAMVSSCHPILDKYGDNYAVEQLLVKKKVIRIGKGCKTDSESCQMYVYFKRMDTAKSFIKRLNAFLVKEGKKHGMRTEEEARVA